MRTDFHALLDEVRIDLKQMVEMVTGRLEGATDALLNGDPAAAEVIIRSDDDLDLVSLEAEEKCVQLLALQQPVAIDLRTIVADIHMIGALERSGDLVTNIAKAIHRLGEIELPPKVAERIQGMCAEGVHLMRLAFDSYVKGDAELADSVGEADDVLDALERDYLEQVLGSSEDGTMTIQQAVQLAVVGRFYERIGDHAVNIAGRVLFLVTGSPPEHSGAERARVRRDAQEARQPPASG